MKYLTEYMFEPNRCFVRYLDNNKTTLFLKNPSIHFTKILEFNDIHDARLNDNFIEFLNHFEKCSDRTNFLKQIDTQAQSKYYASSWSSHTDSYLLWNHYTKKQDASIAIIFNLYEMEDLIEYVKSKIEIEYGYIKYEIKHFGFEPNFKMFNNLYSTFKSGNDYLNQVAFLKNYSYSAEQEFRILASHKVFESEQNIFKTNKGFYVEIDRALFKKIKFMLSPYNSHDNNIHLANKIEAAFDVSRNNFWISSIEERG